MTHCTFTNKNGFNFGNRRVGYHLSIHIYRKWSSVMTIKKTHTPWLEWLIYQVFWNANISVNRTMNVKPSDKLALSYDKSNNSKKAKKLPRKQSILRQSKRNSIVRFQMAIRYVAVHQWRRPGWPTTTMICVPSTSVTGKFSQKVVCIVYIARGPAV